MRALSRVLVVLTAFVFLVGSFILLASCRKDKKPASTSTVRARPGADPADVALFEKVLDTYSSLESFHTKETGEARISMAGIKQATPIERETWFSRPGLFRVDERVTIEGSAVATEMVCDGESLRLLTRVQRFSWQAQPEVFDIPLPDDLSSVLRVDLPSSSDPNSQGSPYAELMFAFRLVSPDILVGPPVRDGAVEATVTTDEDRVLHMIPAPGAEWRAVVDPTTFRLVQWRAVMGPEFLKAAITAAVEEDAMPEQERAVARAMLGAIGDPLIGRMAVAVKIDVEQLDDVVTDDCFVLDVPHGVRVRPVADLQKAMETAFEDSFTAGFNAAMRGGSFPQSPSPPTDEAGEPIAEAVPTD